MLEAMAIIGAFSGENLLSEKEQANWEAAQDQKLRELGLSQEAINYINQNEARDTLTRGDARILQGIRQNLGMHIRPDSSPGNGIWGAGGASVVRGSGFGLSDSAGDLLPGTKGPGFHGVNSGGSIGYTFDGSHFVPGNQALLVDAFFNYRNTNIRFGTTEDLAAVGIDSAGSARFDAYMLGGSARYDFGTSYLRASTAVDFLRFHETLNVDGSTGTFDGHGYWTNLQLGNVFMLLNTINLDNNGLLVKAPRRPTSGYVALLDLSGHVGYRNLQTDEFTDSAGFIVGDSKTRFGTVGGRAKLFWLAPGGGLLWQPYVAATLDQLLGFSTALNIPVQPDLPGGDAITGQVAKTFWGAEGGLDVLNGGVSGWRVGAKVFYTANSDINVAGGQAYLKIPLFQSRPVLR